MDAIIFINELRSELEKLKTSGATGVDIPGLEQYLNLALAEASARGVADAQAAAKARHDMDLYKVQAPLQHASALEMVRSAIAAGGDAVRTLVLINGGAAVALLAFLGNVLTKESRQFPFSLQSMRVAMVTFVVGVGLAGASAAARYLTQFTAASARTRAANWFNFIAIVLGLMSLSAFFRGGFWAYWALG